MWDAPSMVYQERRKRRGDDDDEEKDDNDMVSRDGNRRETQVSSGQMARMRARVFPQQGLRQCRGEKEDGRGEGGGSLTYGARPRERRSALLSVRPRAPLPPRSFDRRRSPWRSQLAELEISVIRHRRKEERGEEAHETGCVSMQVSKYCKGSFLGSAVTSANLVCSFALPTKAPLSTDETTLKEPRPGDVINQSELPRTRSVNQTLTRPGHARFWARSRGGNEESEAHRPLSGGQL